MTVEQRIIQIIGTYTLQVATLQTQLEEARARVAELEKLLQDNADDGNPE